MEEQIQKERLKIDQIDKQIRLLLNERATIAQTIGHLKGESPAYRPEREAQVLRKGIEANSGPLSNQMIFKIQREIMSACLSLEKPQEIGYVSIDFYPLLAIRDQFGHFARPQKIKNFQSALEEIKNKKIDYCFIDSKTIKAEFGKNSLPVEVTIQGKWCSGGLGSYYLIGQGLLPFSGRDKVIGISTKDPGKNLFLKKELLENQTWWVEAEVTSQSELEFIAQKLLNRLIGLYPIIQ